MSVNANIFSVVRASLHDGPGIRTVVYLSGCSMRCQWCHNPEGFTYAPKLMLYPEKCIGCGRCMSICPEHHMIRNGVKVYDAEGCIACGKCATVCPSEAIQCSSRAWTVDEVVDVVKKDKPYFKRSGGGVTFSGGECMLQPNFLAETARKCKEAGIHVLVETALHVGLENLKLVSPWVDQYYVDIKHMSSDVHKMYTGVGNELILQNIHLLTQLNDNILIRTPVIPGVNDDMENLLNTARFAYALRPAVRGYCLLKYNNLGESKYHRLGMDGRIFSNSLSNDREMERLCERLNQDLNSEDFVSFQK